MIHPTDCGPNLSHARRTVVGVGEALFDCFEDREVLGGAPINLVVHANRILQQWGGQAVPVTRIGADRLGERFREELAQRGIDLRFTQIDPARPTGRVDIRLTEARDACYVFQADSAWDAIEYDASLGELAERSDAVVFGTLAQRQPTSRAAIRRFLNATTSALRVLDANLRRDFYSQQILDESLRLATAAKLNREELDAVFAMLSLKDDRTRRADDRARRLAESYDLEWIAVTDGPLGATLYRDGELHCAPARCIDTESDADTVGAGDACCAGLVCGSLLGWSAEETVAFANRLGAFVATRSGATPELPIDLIQHHLTAPTGAKS